MDTTNEPVAWIYDWGDEQDIKTKLFPNSKAKITPLYTHPHSDKSVKAKTLTDEETALKSLYEAVIRYENLSPFPDNYAVESCKYQLHDAKEKARAILRKAQGD